MAGIPSPIKIRKDGVEYISRVDRTKYLLSELVRAALRDVGKFVRRKMLDEVRKLRGMRRGKRPLRAFQYWVRKRDQDLVVGVKHNTWYGAAQELGSSKQPKRQIITKAVMNNIDEIRRIEGQYLSKIEDENKALGLIDENDEGVNEE
jgi:HK97 gp10 family phage protein